MYSRSITCKTSLLLMCCLLLSACSNNELEDLQAYVAEVQSRPGGKIKPLPEIKPFDNFSYDVTHLRDPFQHWFAITAIKQKQGSKDGGLIPDTQRKRSELESFPLDTLQAVGTIKFKGILWALIKTPEGQTTRVKNGSHMGQNFGTVTTISDEKIVLKEIVPDGMNGWQERLTDLPFNQ